MKKNLIKGIFGLMLSALLFSGCQKITEEEMISDDPLSGKNNQDQTSTWDNNNHSCRLLSFEQSDGYHENFHYNHKGLADRWYLEYGDGTAYDYHIKYDGRERIKSVREINPGGAVNYTFYNNNSGQTTRVTGYVESTGELYADIFYKYNHKGQMVKLDETVGDIHTRFFYDNKGYNRRMDLYFGSELFYTLFFNYDIPNKNPYLALKGVDFGFPSYFFNAPLFDKRWNSYGKYFFYDNGNPIAFAEDDPAQTVLQTGRSNYLTYAKYYDVISESFYDLKFAYENCGRAHDNKSETTAAAAVIRTPTMNTMTRLKKIFNQSPKNMKQELIQFNRQYLIQRKL